MDRKANAIVDEASQKNYNATAGENLERNGENTAVEANVIREKDTNKETPENIENPALDATGEEELSDEVERKELDGTSQMIRDGRFNPTLDRTEESPLSIFIKYIVNLGAAIIQTLNYPILFFGLLAVLETTIKWFGNDPQFSFGNKLDWIFYVMFGSLLFVQIYQRTNSNIISPSIDLLWAVNFKGKLNNRFQSLGLSEKRSADLNELISINAKRYSDVREKELLAIIDSQQGVIKQLISDFPDDILQSFIRVSGFPTGVLTDKKHPRYHYEVLMDRLLGEIASLSILNGLVHQGSIMLLEEEETLRIVGQYNLHDNVVELRKIKLGEKFAGKIVESGSVVWIPDIYNEDATQYGFGPLTPKKSYKAIVGVPIRRKGYEIYEPVGIINLHFKTNPNFSVEQQTSISNILEVYTQYIVTLINLSKDNGQTQNIGEGQK